MIIKTAQKLISFKTVSGNYKEGERILDFIQNYFKNLNVFQRRFVSNKFPSLIITLQRTKKPKIFLCGHLDVVPAEDEQFKPRIKGRRLFGRGSGDMKGGAAVLIEIMRYFAQRKKRPSLGLMLTLDEEIGGENGVGYLIQKQNYSSEIAIIPDGGENLETLISKSKGLFWLKITAKGKSVHGSRPWLGENAIERLIEAYLKIRKIFPQIKIRSKNQKKEVCFWKNTINLGKMFGGKSINQVPDSAEMYLDIRFIAERDKNKILKQIKKILNKNYKIEVVNKAYPFQTDLKNPLVKSYIQTSETVLGKPIKTNLACGVFDARFFTEKGIPAIVTQPFCGNIHGDQEWVDIEDLEKFFLILKEFIQKVS